MSFLKTVKIFPKRKNDIKPEGKNDIKPKRKNGIKPNHSLDTTVYPKYFYTDRLPTSAELLIIAQLSKDTQSRCFQELQEAMRADKDNNNAMAQHYANLAIMFQQWEDFKDIDLAIRALNIAISYNPSKEQYYLELCRLYEFETYATNENHESLAIVYFPDHNTSQPLSLDEDDKLILVNKTIERFKSPVALLMRSMHYKEQKKTLSAARDIQTALPLMESMDINAKTYWKAYCDLYSDKDMMELVDKLNKIKKLEATPFSIVSSFYNKESFNINLNFLNARKSKISEIKVLIEAVNTLLYKLASKESLEPKGLPLSFPIETKKQL